MKIGKYIIRLSERGTHYLELVGGWLCIAVTFIILLSVGIWLFMPTDTLQVTHIYENGCIDLYDTKKQTYKFYCEDHVFYSDNK